LKEIIQKYIDNNNQEFQRYNSWNHCYVAFGNTKLSKDILALHLGFYLASWGMYRGSSGLLQKDYKIHIETVEIIGKYPELRCSKNNEVDVSCITEIVEIIKHLKEYYESFQYITSKNKSRNITSTDTLISKILLGTLGCLPAFDRLFIKGVKKSDQEFKNLKEKSINSLFDYVGIHNEELKEIQTLYPQYPIMKLIDMYFWQVGFDL